MTKQSSIIRNTFLRDRHACVRDDIYPLAISWSNDYGAISSFIFFIFSQIAAVLTFSGYSIPRYHLFSPLLASYAYDLAITKEYKSKTEYVFGRFNLNY